MPQHFNLTHKTMEQTNNPNILKSTMTSGAILGAALLIYSLILYMTNLTFSTALGYVSYVLMIGGIILGIKNYRDQEQEGYITYGRALGVGMLTVLFASIIMAAFIYVLYSMIDPGLIDKSLDIARTKLMEKHTMSDEQIESAIDMSKKFMTPLFMAFGTIVGNAFTGLIFSLIICAFMKKEKSIFTNTIDAPLQ